MERIKTSKDVEKEWATCEDESPCTRQVESEEGTYVIGVYDTGHRGILDDDREGLSHSNLEDLTRVSEDAGT